MNANIHKSFTKSFDRLDIKIQQAFKKRLLEFIDDPYKPELKNHALRGKWLGNRSINISGDFRALYKEVSENEALFVAIGTHSQLYR